MRKILTIFIVLILVVGIVSVAKSTNYDIDTDVSGSWPSTYTSNVRHVVQSSDGTIVVFYFSAKSGGGLVVRKSTSSGVTDSWTDLAGGAGYTVIDSNYSSIRGYSIDIDDNDNIYVAYDDDNDIKFMKLEASPGTWTTWSLGTERTVDAANNNAYPSITRQSNGRVWVSYGQDNGTSAWLRAMYSDNDFQTAGTQTTVDSGGTFDYLYPSALVLRNDVPYIVYNDGDLGDLRRAYWNGSSWSGGLVNDMNPSPSSNDFSVTLITTTVHVVWLNQGTLRHTYSYDGTTWSSTMTVSTSEFEGYEDGNPSLTTDWDTDDQELWVYAAIYYKDESSAWDHYNIKYKKWSGSTWPSWTAVSTNNMENIYPGTPFVSGSKIPVAWGYDDDPTYSPSDERVKFNSDKVTLDITPPGAPTSVSAIPSGWTYTNLFSVNWTNPDDPSGIAGAYYKLDSAPTSNTDGTWKTDKPITNITVTGDGAHTIYIWVRDHAGNINYLDNDTTLLKLDATAPGTPQNVDDGVSGSSNDNTPTFTWDSVTDTSGVDGYWCAVDDDTPESGGSWTTTTSSTTAPLSDGTHTFYVKAENGAGLYSVSPGSHTCVIDTTAPAAITDLTGLYDNGSGDVTLSWSTPGDDGWNNTLADGSKYRIDYSSYSIAWSTNTYDVEISTSGVAPYTEVFHTITGLQQDTTWYFRIWTRDEVPNWSGLSNGATVWTGVAAPSTNTYTWTDAAEDGDWTNSNNWSGADGYPDGANDKAVINTSTRTINTPASALTIGQLELGSSYSGTLTLGNDLILDDSGGWDANLTISNANATLYLAGKNLTLETGSTFSNNGTLRLQGGETLTEFTNDTDSGTVEYVGDGDAVGDFYYIKNSGTTDYYHLTINSTDGATDTFRPDTTETTLTVAGNFTLSTGTFTTYDGTTDRNLSVTGNVDIDGTFDANSSTITVGGNWDSSAPGTFNYGTSTVDLTGTGNLKTAAAFFYNLTCAAPGKTTTLQSHIYILNTLTLGNGGTLTDGASSYFVFLYRNGGTPLIREGATITIEIINYYPASGTVTVAGGNYGVTFLQLYSRGSNVTFNLGSDITVNGIFRPMAVNGATNVVCNTQDNNITTGNLALGSDTANGSTTLNCGTSSIDIDPGSLFVVNAGGSHTLNLSSATFTCAGNWQLVNGTGTITQIPGTSTVIFDGPATSTSTLVGSTTFYVLISTTTGKNIEFVQDTFTGVTGHLNFENITLHSFTDNATWYLNLAGTQDVSNVDVRDSNASGGDTIIAFNSTDSGNNTNWDFGPPEAITDLTGQYNSGTGDVILSWSTPGDDYDWQNTLVDGSKYRIDYSSYSIAWSTNTYDVDIPTHSVTPHTQVSRTITGLQQDTNWYFRIWTADEIPLWSGLSNGATVWTGVAGTTVTVSAYTAGTPDVPPTYTQSTDNCLGTFRFEGEGTITGLTITEYGTCDADGQLENVELYEDDGDGNWESGQDTTKLGSTANFNASNKATFSGFSLAASTYCYVHVILDVKSTADSGSTVGIELYQNDIVCTSTTTASSWPVQLETSMIIGENTPPSFNNSSFRSQNSNDVWITESEWNDDLIPNTKVEVEDTGAGLRIGSQEVAPDTHTVLLLHLNNNTTDYSGHGNNGTRQGGVDWISTDTWKTGGDKENILYFDGNDDYVDLGQPSSLNVDYITISAWVKYTKAPSDTDDPTIIGRDDLSNRVFAFYQLDSNTLRFFVFSGNNAKIKDTSFTPTVGQWYHFVGTADGSDVRIYIDGTDVGSPTSYSGVMDKDSVDTYIGSDATGVHGNWNGLIDEVRILDRALTAEEVAADYYSGLFKYSKDGGSTWYSISGSTVAWSTGTVTGVNGSTSYETIYASNVPFNQYSGTDNKIKFLISDTNGNVAESSEYTVKIGSITVSVYTDGDPDVPPSTVGQGTTGNCLGTFRFEGAGTISSMTITEYGTCDADGELENVKLFQDDGDGDWEESADDTQLGSTTTFNASNKATFSGFSLAASTYSYVHVVLDVKSTAQLDNTIGIELYQSDIVCTSTTTASSWPVQLSSSTIKDLTPPAAITDLTGECDGDTGDVTLSWSTPGDDGWNNTLADGSKYRIDYSTYVIAWSTNTYDVEIPTHSVTPHTEVCHTITGLTGDTSYYFRIWTADEVPNWSGLSNGATVWVTVVGTNTYTWTGGGAYGVWADSDNWTGAAGYPDDAKDKAVINLATSENINTGAALTIGELELGGSYSGTLTLGGVLTLDDSEVWNGDLTIGAGTLDVSGSNHQINIDGNWSSSGTFEARSSTVTLEGSSGSQTVTSGGQSFYNLVINNTGTSVQLEDALDVDGNLTISAGTLDTKSGENNPINIAGNWAYEGGAFECRQSTVTFDNASSTSTLTGSTTFYGLVSTANGKKVKVSSDTVIDVTGHLNFENITLRSTLDGATWYLNLSGSHDVSNVNVMDSNASGGYTVFAVGSTNSGNNTNWVFLTGNARYWVGGTGNWSDAANHWSATSGGTPGATKPESSDTAIFDVNSGGGTCTINEAVSIKGLLMKNGYSGTITQGANTITIGNDNAVFSGGTFTGGSANITVNGNMTISGTAFTSTSGTLTVKYTWTFSSGSFAHNDGTVDFPRTTNGPYYVITGETTFYNLTFSGDKYGWDISDNLVVENDLTITGTYSYASPIIRATDAGTYTITVLGNVSHSGQAHMERDLTIIMDGAEAQTIGNSSTGRFGSLKISNDSATISLSNNLKLTGSLTIDADTILDVTAYDYNITIGKGWTRNGTFTQHQGTVDFERTQNFGGVGYHRIIGETTFYNLTFSGDRYGWDISDNLVVENDFTITGTYSYASPIIRATDAGTYTITVKGNVSHSGNPHMEKDLTIVMDGTSTQTIGTSGAGKIGSLQISNTSGNDIDLSSALNLYTGSTCTIGAGTALDLSGNALSVPSTFTNNGTLKLQGDESVSTPTNNPGSTVEYTATSGSRAIKNWTYQSLKINGADGTFTLGTGETVYENLIVSTGTFDLNGFALSISSATTIEAGAVKTSTNTVTFGNGIGDDSVTITGGELHIESDNTSSDIELDLGSGSWSNTGGTIIYDGSTVNTNLLSSLSPYNNLTIDSTGSTYTLNGDITVNGDLTINNGTLNTAASNHAISVGGDWNRAGGTFTVNNSTVTFITASSTSTLTGSTTFYGLVSTASGKNVKVSSDTIVDVIGYLNFENITLRSTLNGATWYLNLSGSGTQDVSGVDVRDSNASGGDTIIAFNSTDSGNNTNWDFGPPAAITDLSGQCDGDTGDVTLSWSTPGDDGWNNTLADGSKYRIDYSTYVIAWSTNTYDVEIPTHSVTPHTEVCHTITGLTGDTSYYFRIWTADEIPNWSGLSNGCTVWVNPIISIDIQPSTRPFGEVPANESAVLSDGFTVENTGNITQKYQLRLTGVPTGWTAKNVAGAPEWNEVKILGLFTTQSPPNTTYFNDNPPDLGDGDIVRTTSDDEATSTNFAISGEGVEVKGYNVTVGGIRYLWFRFDAPSGTSITNQQFLTVTVTAIQQ